MSGGQEIGQDRAADVPAQVSRIGRDDRCRCRDGVGRCRGQHGEADAVHIKIGFGEGGVGGSADECLIGRQECPDLLLKAMGTAGA